jgi:hypothetical protein
MSDRWQKRKYSAETAAIIRKAKKDMMSWIGVLGYSPNEQEVRAWQAGYIAGINRATGASGK